MEKIYPTAEELSTIETSLKCTESNCTAIFKCKSNLHLHLATHHGNKNLTQQLLKSNIEKIFFCPLKTCIYHALKSFKSMKYLKQHYLKVHAVKSYKCAKCALGFSTECLKRLHEDYCGVIFKCPDCTVQYNSYDTLTTHARRKGHKIFTKDKYKSLFEGDATACSRIVCVLDHKPEKRLILPKELLKYNTQDKIKEDAVGDNAVNKRKRKNRSEMQTQTQRIKAVKSTAGTQTEVVSIRVPETNAPSSTKKSIKTQTTTVTSSSRACNTSFEINHASTSTASDFPIERATLGTQTLSPNILTQPAQKSSDNNVSEHVDQSIGTDDLLESFINDISSTNFCNTDMETQTEWLSDLALLSNEVHSNNYTQTCDDILPPDLRFNNTHTQTVLNDILRSVGSQTNIRVNGGVFTNNETQTDSIFEELLQEINS